MITEDADLVELALQVSPHTIEYAALLEMTLVVHVRFATTDMPPPCLYLNGTRYTGKTWRSSGRAGSVWAVYYYVLEHWATSRPTWDQLPSGRCVEAGQSVPFTFTFNGKVYTFGV